MRHLPKFRYYRPKALNEVLDLLKEHEVQAKLLAGGTDLVVLMKEQKISPEVIIDLSEVRELSHVEEGEGVTRIGATVKLSTLEGLPQSREAWRLLAQAAHRIGSPQIRFRGTIGGNVCNASPAADMAAPLLAMEAGVVLVSKNKERTLPLESFFKGPGVTALGSDEVLKEIVVPDVPPRSFGAYLKLGRRKSMDLAVVSAVVLLTLGPDKKTCERARIAFGSVAPVPLRAKETEAFLHGRVLTDEAILEGAHVAKGESRPISDIRATALYRRKMVGVLFRRAVREALAART